MLRSHMPQFVYYTLHFAAWIAVAANSVAQEISFARNVQPLLAKHCFACHGPADQEAGVAFHVREAAIAKSKNGRFPIIPENPDASELLHRVTAADEAKRERRIQRHQVLLAQRGGCRGCTRQRTHAVAHGCSR